MSGKYKTLVSRNVWVVGAQSQRAMQIEPRGKTFIVSKKCISISKADIMDSDPMKGVVRQRHTQTTLYGLTIQDDRIVLCGGHVFFWIKQTNKRERGKNKKRKRERVRAYQNGTTAIATAVRTNGNDKILAHGCATFHGFQTCSGYSGRTKWFLCITQRRR